MMSIRAIVQRSALVAVAVTGLCGVGLAEPAVENAVRAPRADSPRADGARADSPSKVSPAQHVRLLPPPMTVAIVRSAVAGCEPDCPQWIAAQGMIDGDALAKFKKVLRSLGSRRLAVVIDSGGGLVDDSLAIGRLIRTYGLDVAVAKTMFVACADANVACKADVAHGIKAALPVARLAKCASSCAFILAAGRRRIVSATAFVGVHQLKTLRTTAQVQQKFRIDRQMIWGVPTETKRTLISERLVNKKTTEARTPDSAYAKVAAYFDEMGVGPGIMPILRSAPNSSIHWLSRGELKATGMATESDIALRVSGAR